MSDLPHDPVAEESVLGAMLLDPAAITAVQDLVGGRDFHSPANEVIFDAIASHARDGKPADPVSIAATLQAAGELRQAGGPARLAKLYGEVPSAKNATHYARIVADLSVRRDLIRAGIQTQQLGYSTDGDDVDSLVTEAGNLITDVAARRTIGGVPWVADVADDAMNAIGQCRSTPTPWRDLNEKIIGWEPGCVYVIGARPATGKTLVGVQAAVDLVLNYDVGALYLSLEMKAARLYQRALARISSVDHQHIKTGELSEFEWRALAKADGQLRPKPLAITDDRKVTLSQVFAKARAANREHRLGLVVVDYLQLLHADPTKNRDRNREREVAEISGGLHELAGELDVPVVVLAQLNRNPAGRADKRPLMSDLRESGSVEQDADVVILLHRDEDADDDVERGKLHMLVAKNRDGATGPIELRWEAQHSRIVDWQWSPSDSAMRAAS